MFYASDISAIIATWLERLENPNYPDAYRDALSDCTYELISFMNKLINDQLEVLSKLTPEQREAINEQCIKQAAGY